MVLVKKYDGYGLSGPWVETALVGKTKGKISTGKRFGVG